MPAPTSRRIRATRSRFPPASAIPIPAMAPGDTRSTGATARRARAARRVRPRRSPPPTRSEEHTSELQSPCNLVCRLLLEKKTDGVLVDREENESVASEAFEDLWQQTQGLDRHRNSIHGGRPRVSKYRALRQTYAVDISRI